ncbi:hypothetical protein [Pseudaquabacterium rugosum]|uniref:Lipoprotein n=1 Tax=Pseudaquabacterium rugosum TaxID=2984194 RepID=A0ABU9B6A5_9BURK
MALTLTALAELLAGCAGPRYTVDDGRKVDEVLLGQIRDYGTGERALRPAIARSAALQDPDCDKQWELPFSVATSADWSEDERVAWVRGLGVDERLTVVAAARDAPLQPGERLVAIGKVAKERDSTLMLETLAERRDAGEPFSVRTASGRTVQVRPFEVCRGYTRLAPPNTPKAQDYHWLLSVHPLQLPRAALTDDEALWVVLWTQGLSEEGGLRMKTWHYGTKIAGTLYNLVTLASGIKGAALAADAALKAAQSAAAQVASEVLKQQLIDQAKALAVDRLRAVATGTLDKFARATVVNSIQQAAVNRGALSGVARIGATAFDEADGWAFKRLGELDADPLAPFTLHQKLAEAGLADNAFVFDGERLGAISTLARQGGLEARVTQSLKGLRVEELQAEIGAMPLASAPAPFSYEEPLDDAANPYARGLVDALLEMPGAPAAAPATAPAVAPAATPPATPRPAPAVPKPSAAAPGAPSAAGSAGPAGPVVSGPSSDVRPEGRS